MAQGAQPEACPGMLVSPARMAGFGNLRRTKNTKTEMITHHTPGDWKVSGSCHVKPTTDGKFYHVAHVVEADDYAANPMIAEVACRGQYTSESAAHTPGAEQLANARLIAAAPKLLAALELMLRVRPSGIFGFQDELTNLRYAREAAIEAIKATQAP